MEWLNVFSRSAEKTDRFKDGKNHALLLATGLIGEAGSVLTELKKSERERNAYPVYRDNMFEEVGDFLWYFVRLVSQVDPLILDGLTTGSADPSVTPLVAHLEFGAATGRVLARITQTECVSKDPELSLLLKSTWHALAQVAGLAELSLQQAAESNIKKIESRWPEVCRYRELFDNDVEEEEQLPRKLEVEFREREHGERKTVFLRCNELNFGDRLTDNIEDPDGYRFHDIFHFAYAVHLGWSPVIRALLKCKRKSISKTDEGQDGARAIIVEEAVSAIVFSRSKQLAHFDGIEQVDYDLLKTVQEFVQGFEVDQVPLWQWEIAILEGNRIFRQLRANRGGTIKLDLINRQIKYFAPKR